MSFTGGETCRKVYKNNFYIGLTNFITGFFEWEKNYIKRMNKIILFLIVKK